LTIPYVTEVMNLELDVSNIIVRFVHHIVSSLLSEKTLCWFPVSYSILCLILPTQPPSLPR
jgi:hypothetical protein